MSEQRSESARPRPGERFVDDGEGLIITKPDGTRIQFRDGEEVELPSDEG